MSGRLQSGAYVGRVSSSNILDEDGKSEPRELLAQCAKVVGETPAKTHCLFKREPDQHWISGPDTNV